MSLLTAPLLSSNLVEQHLEAMLDWLSSDPSAVFVIAIALVVFLTTAWLLWGLPLTLKGEKARITYKGRNRFRTRRRFNGRTYTEDRDLPYDLQLLNIEPSNIPPCDTQPFDITNIGHQLKAVASAPFKVRKIMNMSEYKTFRIVENLLSMECKDCRVFSQVSLGEVLMSSEPNAFRSINSKRLDMLVVDKAGWPILAIEYQGAGHYQDNVIGRDAVKKEALRKAGVKFLEVVHDDSVEQIECHVREKIGLSASGIGKSGLKESKLRMVAGA